MFSYYGLKASKRSFSLCCRDSSLSLSSKPTQFINNLCKGEPSFQTSVATSSQHHLLVRSFKGLAIHVHPLNPSIDPKTTTILILSPPQEVSLILGNLHFRRLRLEAMQTSEAPPVSVGCSNAICLPPVGKSPRKIHPVIIFVFRGYIYIYIYRKTTCPNMSMRFCLTGMP